VKYCWILQFKELLDNINEGYKIYVNSADELLKLIPVLIAKFETKCQNDDVSRMNKREYIPFFKSVKLKVGQQEYLYKFSKNIVNLFSQLRLNKLYIRIHGSLI